MTIIEVDEAGILKRCERDSCVIECRRRLKGFLNNFERVTPFRSHRMLLILRPRFDSRHHSSNILSEKEKKLVFNGKSLSRNEKRIQEHIV